MIHKSFLRILLCNALADKQGNQYATIAENRVHETELDDLDARNEGADLSPCILIYTDSSSTGNLNGQNTSNLSTYVIVKVKIELIIFGGYAGFGLHNNNDKFLSILSDVFEQQVYDALFKAQNENAQKFRDKATLASSLQVTPTNDSQSQRKIFSKMIEIDIQLPEQYNSLIYPQDRIDILDYYQDYISLLPNGMRHELEKMLSVNDATKLEILNTELPTPTIQIEFENE